MASEKRSRRRYELREPDLDARIEALVASAEERFGPLPDANLLREILVTGLGLAREGATTGDLKLINSSFKELRHSLRVFRPYESVRKLAVFGSARTQPGAPAWEQARAFCERMAREGWMTITGGGGGIMEAAQTGAGREASFGVNIHLPFEQHPNPVIAGDPKLINFRYFFSRKITFVREAHAIVLLPGGFGTHDEGFEALTLIQTGKSEMLPVVFIDAPGDTYWRDWGQYVRSHLAARELISQPDLSLFLITDDVDEAVGEVLGFYRNYHSSRYVGDRLVLRLCQAPTPEQLELLNDEFSDLLTKGSIEASAPLRPEEDEAVGLPRIVLRFDRRSVGRLRQLIDRLNGFAEVPSALPATPREIPASELSEDEERLRDEL